MLAGLVARFQHPLEYAVEPVGIAASQTGLAGKREELLSEVHTVARTSHLLRRHDARTAERLGIDPGEIEFGAGGSSSGEGDKIAVTRKWIKGPAVSRLNTFYMEDQEIITFDEAEISRSGSELTYKLRVLTPTAESEAELNVAL